MGKMDPRPYRRTLARAGTSWVVVTSTFTQFGRDAISCKHFMDSVNHWSVKISMSWRTLCHFSRFSGSNRPVKERENNNEKLEVCAYKLQKLSVTNFTGTHCQNCSCNYWRALWSCDTWRQASSSSPLHPSPPYPGTERHCCWLHWTHRSQNYSCCYEKYIVIAAKINILLIELLLLLPHTIHIYNNCILNRSESTI